MYTQQFGRDDENIIHASGFSLGIRGRLLLGFAAVAIILLCAVGATLFVVKSSETYAAKVIEIELPTYDKVLDLGLQLSQTQAYINAWVITGDPKYKTLFEQTWTNIAKLQFNIDELLKNIPTSNVTRANWEEVKSLLGQMRVEGFALLMKVNGNTSDIKNSIKTLNDIENKLSDILDGSVDAAGVRVGGIYDAQYNLVHAGTEKILADLATIKTIEYILIVLIIIVSVIISLITANRIINPLMKAIMIAKNISAGKRDNKIEIYTNDETGMLLAALASMQDAIKSNEEKLEQSEIKTRQLFESIVNTAKTFSSHSSKVAAGDLRQRLSVVNDDVMAQLGKDLNLMTESLASITKQITQASHNMVSTLDEVKQAVDVQSSGATEQASSINEITASLEEIEKSSAQTMEKAKMLGNVAERTREKGQQGLEAVEQSILGMKSVRDKVQMIAQTILELSNQTQQIGEITSAVNTLAQQSKMLALNASIEAAKAGEAGKGFAVVASEVKNLAEQSEQSTAQVQKILEDIRRATEKAVMVTEEGTKGVDHGTTLVEQTGEIVRGLSDVIHETTIASQQIEAAVRQEGVGIEQITVGMNEINQVTSAFVASAKQTLVAINNLADITKKLKEQVDTYKV